MTAQLAPRPGRESARKPTLRAVAPPQLRPTTLPFVVMMAVLIAIGMTAMVVLTTVLQEQAFAVQAKQHQANALANRVSQLEAQVANARSISHLAIAAQDLGMRPNPNAVPMRLSDGKVFGNPRPVLGDEVPGVRYLSDAEAAAQVAAIKQAEADRKARQEAAAAAKKAAEQAAAAAAAAAATTPGAQG